MPEQPMERLSAGEIRSLLSAGQLSVEQLGKALLKRIAAREEEIKAWVYLDPQRVLDEAKRLDACSGPRGPLFGVPVAVKDLFYTKDMPTAQGSARYADHFPTVDASVVAVLRDAGCLILGKTVTTEFAFTMNGKDTTNPHNSQHTPGGSSSGSAAAVADLQVPISIGSQTFGSIVRPASYVGVYGWKPTWNVISMGGSRAFAPALDTIGFFTRTVEDQEMVADCLRLEDISPSTYKTLKEAKFATCKPSQAVWDRATPETIKIFEAAQKLLQDQGATVEELVLPPEFDNWQEWHLIIACKELETHMLAETLVTEKGIDKMDSIIQGFLEKAKTYSTRQYQEALDGYRNLMALFDRLAGEYDAVLTLSATGEAPKGLQFTGDSSFCTLWTALHVPVINIPGFGGANGLPIGLSLLAPRWKDRHLLKVAKDVGQVFESRGNWKSQIL